MAASPELAEAHYNLGVVLSCCVTSEALAAGTHQGAVSREHLDSYLDEFTFRFNRRTWQHRGRLFYRLVQQAVAVRPALYDAIIKHVRARQSGKHKQ